MIKKFCKDAIIILFLALCIALVILSLINQDLKIKLCDITEQIQITKNSVYDIRTKENIARNFEDTLESFDVQYKEVSD